ncbi:HGR081Cp [Eremothecium sinecaudum]|uniref:HGR081Cp n=1 Tax=Eremothecium sinecaudum TaxID=45286 RepID=A0A0X8HVU4_9SACH|nr:HGR081Cp [Eremothecium sinecaudum]AMD22420.1 HGR081Cp [Eremothecium sinecaudum]
MAIEKMKEIQPTDRSKASKRSDKADADVTVVEGNLAGLSITDPASGGSGVQEELNTSRGNSSSLQLEQLENTNLLTVRIKWAKPDNLMDDYKLQLLNRCSDAVLFNRGFPINPSIIENYEYFSDSKRLLILKENEDIYPFEVGTEEYARSYGKEMGTWLYDLVLQAQFKTFADLAEARDAIKELIVDNKHVEEWSISQNLHALTHPGNLYIRGIPKDLTVEDLLPIFTKFGPLLSLKIIVDVNTGKSLGYGFISYPLGSQAARCIKELNGNLMNGSLLFINYHVERKERERIHLDHLKEDNDDERFRGVFVGNLPSENEDGTLITPGQVFEKFKEILDPVEILSYYFPKRNSNTNIEYKDDDHSMGSNSRENIETCASQNEISPLKGYGFMKFSTHDMALKAIDVLNDYNWLDHILVVNKAVQNRPIHNHGHHHHHRSSSNRASVSSRQSSGSSMPYFGPTGPSGATIHPPSPAFPMFAPAFSVSPTGSEGVSADRSPVLSGSSGCGSPQVNSLTQGPVFTAQSPALSPDSVTAPRSRHGSFYLPSCPVIYSTSGNIPGAHSQFGHHGNAHSAAAAAAAAAFGGLPIPTRDQQESNLYVKHIPLSWKDEDLNALYSQYGEIISAKIITVGGSKNDDGEMKYTLDDVPVGTSRGYGFVCFKNPLDASRAMMATDRFQVEPNHVLYVSFAQKRGKSVSMSSSSPNSSGNSVHYSSGSGPSSSHSSYHNNSRQNPFNSIMGNYNTKFINAMIQQQNQQVNSSPNNHNQAAGHRGSWAGPNQQPSYMLPIVLPPPPPVNVPRSSSGSNKKLHDTFDSSSASGSTVIDIEQEPSALATN